MVTSGVSNAGTTGSMGDMGQQERQGLQARQGQRQGRRAMQHRTHNRDGERSRGSPGLRPNTARRAGCLARRRTPSSNAALQLQRCASMVADGGPARHLVARQRTHNRAALSVSSMRRRIGACSRRQGRKLQKSAGGREGAGAGDYDVLNQPRDVAVALCHPHAVLARCDSRRPILPR